MSWPKLGTKLKKPEPEISFKLNTGYGVQLSQPLGLKYGFA